MCKLAHPCTDLAPSHFFPIPVNLLRRPSAGHAPATEAAWPPYAAFRFASAAALSPASLP
jgi:hypothetical protein